MNAFVEASFNGEPQASIRLLFACDSLLSRKQAVGLHSRLQIGKVCRCSSGFVASADSLMPTGRTKSAASDCTVSALTNGRARAKYSLRASELPAESEAMFLILRPVRLLFKALIAESKPRQLAQGFAFGVLIGLVPKDNLLAPLLGVILAASRANLGVAAGTVLIVSFLSPFLDPVSDAVGGWLLGLPALQSMWTQLYNMPVVPWTSFNNSVVLGSFVLGLILLYPMYKASKPLFKKYSERLSKWARKFRLTKALLGAEWADRFGTAGQA